MDGLRRPTFLQRATACTVDIVVALGLMAVDTAAWVVWTLSDPMRAAKDPIALLDTDQVLQPVVLATWLLYLVASWTPLLGRRTIGMRSVGIAVMRDHAG